MDQNLNKKSPLVSVVMAVYNGQTYLNEAIESILNQTFIDFEFIIINDGSSDNSLAIINSYTDKRVICIDNFDNMGLIYSLNKGIEIANGKYIARMDADDISCVNRLMEQVDFLENNESVGVLGCNYIQFNENSETEYLAIQNQEEIMSNMIFNASVIHPSLLIRKSVLVDQLIIFNPSYKHAEDYELWSRLIFLTQFSSVPKTLFKYRVHNKQVTSVHNIEQQNSANLVRESILTKVGFVFSKSELNIHCKLGISQFLIDFNDLIDAEKWLKSLLCQNNNIKKIDLSVFKKVISKQWIDTCGNTNLGLKAFLFYFKSDLSKLANENLTKLLLKCIFRKFKQ
jgi:glycosyltransferase involved in cell wall biosynthesis